MRSLEDEHAIRKGIEELNKKFDSHIASDTEFKRKLEVAISQVRELDENLADKMDELIHDWNNL